ncbi:sterol desaturase family protein [Aquabacterium sp. J223]|uniref:sterol desaturase family protein n=1 Tax=Aquabacterium sp. J223 TaxID=2898431 RepID=UPI0021ADC0A6|nr:sterol desaturase family protein [Aquabacterium sp. J223]UUX97533.1 sterol desaturase family protein [Aquabacterium sp. J223]
MNLLSAPLDALADAFGQAQQALYEGVVQPLLFALGEASAMEDAYAGTGWLLVGLIQIGLMVLLMGWLERRWPAEPLQDRQAVRVDMAYTLLHRLGLFRLVLFFTIDPLLDGLLGRLRTAGLPTLHVDALWPGVTDGALVSFLIYLLLFDFIDYWLHRAQHGWRWWWQLHALHHSQRQMTMWSDNRNHLLDDLLRDVVFVVAALGVGIGPGQFVGVIAVTQLLESLSHANTRLSFGPLLSRVLVSPRFHRLHHSIGDGHESRGPGSLGGRNFGVLFSFWDTLFRSGDFSDRVGPTGIRDQLPEHGARDYGRGFWAQQWLGLKRLFS